MFGIGIDTGGTCTDAVIYDLDTKKILATGKTQTTKSNLEIGIGKVLDQLPDELLQQAECIALSTTLATNACVENKGSRAKLLLIGAAPEMMQRLEQTLSAYGIRDMSQLIVLDAKPENLFSNSYDPDWEDLAKRAPELFADCDSVGIVQTYPDANGGRFEMTALRILRDRLTIPLTIAYDISQESDILKVCASTLLNARLIPLIAEFMEAVHHVVNDRGLKDVPIYIVRSDGSLMSEEMARTCPVETLLCGPAASVIGGSELAQEKNAIVVDMGGTTTDLALVQNQEPVMTPAGIFIGNYRTAIKGLDARATSLGGDTAVRYKEGQLFLDTVRVIPISILAADCEHVFSDIRKLAVKKRTHTRSIHEFFVLQKDIAGKNGYNEYERRVCEVLKDGPLIMQEFLEKTGGDLYHMGTDRLEQEGIIIRAGLTPTDIMILKGDFEGYDGAAARELLTFFSLNIGVPEEEIPDMIYDMVLRRMYKSVGAFALQHEFSNKGEYYAAENIDTLLDSCYEQAVSRQAGRKEEGATDLTLSLSMPLIGIGAPIHVFLEKTAALLRTRGVVPECAHVANAAGAIAGRRVARLDLPVIAKYDGYSIIGYTVVADCKMHMIKQRETAVEFAKQVALEEIRKRAQFQGLGDDPLIVIETEEVRIRPSGVLLEITVHAKAEYRKQAEE